MTAEDFFEWARQCAIDKDRAETRRRHLYDRRSSSPTTVSSSASDPMGFVDAAIDREAELVAEIMRCEDVRAKAANVIAAVERAMPGPAGAILELYYMDLAGTWDEIAMELHVSIANLYRIRRQAMEWVNWSGLVADVGRAA